MATSLNAKTRATDLRPTDIFHVMRDPDLPSRQDLGLSGAVLHALRNALAPRGGIALDGSAGMRIYSALGGQGIGADAFSVVCVIRVPTAVPTSKGIWGIGSSLSDFVSSSGPNASLSLTPADQLCVSIGRSSGVYIVSGISGFTANYAGKVVVIGCVFDRVSADPLIYVNGVAQSVTRMFSQGAAWTDSITSTYLGLGWQDTSQGSRFVGAVHSETIYNLALAPNDMFEIMELGGGVPDRFKWGSQASLYVSNYSAGVDSWASDGAFGGTVTGNTDTSADGAGIPPSDDWLRSSHPTSSGQTYAYRSSAIPGLVAGKAARYIADILIPTSANFGYVRVGTLNGSVSAGTASVIPVVKGSVMHIDAPFLAVAGGIQIMASDASGTVVNAVAGDAIYQKNVVIKQAGALVHHPFDDGLGYQLQDISTNRLHAVMSATGVSHIAPLYGPARVRGTTNTIGNQQLLGQVVIPGNSQIMRLRLKPETGTPTIKLGTTSGGAELVASITLTAGWNNLTVGLPGGMVGASAISIWINSSTSDVIDHDHAWEPLST